MPGTPGRVRESLTALEVFPRPLPAEAQDFQLCQLPQRLLRRKMGPRGKLVYVDGCMPRKEGEQALSELVRLDGLRVCGRRVGVFRRMWRGRRLPPELCAQVGRDRDLARHSFPEEQLGAFGEGIGGRATHGENLAARRKGVASSHESAGARAGAHDHGGVGKARDDPVATGKVRAGGRRPGHELAQDRSRARRYPVEQVAVLGRIGLVDAASEDRDGAAFAPERSGMGRGVYAPRPARHDLDRSAGEPFGEGPRYPESEIVAVARSDDRDPLRLRHELSPDVQQRGRIRGSSEESRISLPAEEDRTRSRLVRFVEGPGTEPDQIGLLFEVLDRRGSQPELGRAREQRRGTGRERKLEGTMDRDDSRKRARTDPGNRREGAGGQDLGVAGRSRRGGRHTIPPPSLRCRQGPPEPTCACISTTSPDFSSRTLFTTDATLSWSFTSVTMRSPTFSSGVRMFFARIPASPAMYELEASPDSSPPVVRPSPLRTTTKVLPISTPSFLPLSR